MTKRTIFTSCIKPGPLAVTRLGSNPGAHALITRTAPAGDLARKPNTEDNDMADAAELARIATAATTTAALALARMDDVTRLYLAGLTDEAATTFLARKPDEQKAEAVEAKRVADEAQTAEAARAAGVSEKELVLQRKLDASDTRIAELERRLGDSDLQAVARSADFRGFPGGETEVVQRLKDMKALPADAQDRAKADMKRTAELARRTAQLTGVSDTVDVTRTKPATDRVMIEAKRRVTAGEAVDVNRAVALMTKESVWRADLDAMRAEEEGGGLEEAA